MTVRKGRRRRKKRVGRWTRATKTTGTKTLAVRYPTPWKKTRFGGKLKEGAQTTQGFLRNPSQFHLGILVDDAAALAKKANTRVGMLRRQAIFLAKRIFSAAPILVGAGVVLA
jgi:hypothetical protein